MNKTTSVVLLALIGQAEAKKCPFGFGGSDDNDSTHPKVEAQHPMVGAFLTDSMTCSSTAASTSSTSFGNTEYEAVVNTIQARWNALSATVSNNSNERGSYAGCLVRLAGHDFMDYRVGGTGGAANHGGSDGCINFADADNTGLSSCITEFNVNTDYQNHCTTISLADYIVIQAEAVMGIAATGYSESNKYASGGLLQRFRDTFKFGRTTETNCSWNTGLMPNPVLGCLGLGEIFLKHIYSGQSNPWALTAAISGAHTLGSATIANSGFDGFWSDSGAQGQFNNDYYKSMIAKGWTTQTSVNGVSGKNQWARADRGRITNHKEMMLDTDICLAYRHTEDLNAGNTSGAFLLAGQGQRSCCTWLNSSVLYDSGAFAAGVSNRFCGETVTTNMNNNQQGGERGDCCNTGQGRRQDCDSRRSPTGPAFATILSYIANEQTFYNDFLQAWTVATTNGMGITSPYAANDGMSTSRYNTLLAQQETFTRGQFVTANTQIDNATGTTQVDLSAVEVTSIQQLIELEGYTDGQKFEMFWINFWIIFVWFDYASWGSSSNTTTPRGGR